MSTKFNLYVPIEKIDTEKRTVAGWATTEEIDKQNEIVDYNGSKEAFSKWQGNIREMHEAKAVGKAIEITPNDDTKKIWIEAYISKGAGDTWEKIKEGILNGFSIGGQTVNKVQEVIKDLDTGSSRNISRITKYKLNELSLVDNPANPGCSFSLIKSINGIPYQTEIVEDIKKVVITEATDPLFTEVKEHREKADSLVRKVLNTEQLEKLSDDDFGVIRKSVKDSVVTKERLIPMPDKVHAVRALETMEKYNLVTEETDAVLDKAQEVLGSAFESHVKDVYRGGNNVKIDELNKKVDALVEVVTNLADIIDKAYEGAYKPIEGSKGTPKGSTSDPDLGETDPLDSGAAADVDPQNQHAEGNYPYGDDDPEKADYVEVEGEFEKEDHDETEEEVEKDGHDSEGDKYPGKHPATVDAQTQDPEGAYPYEDTEPEGDEDTEKNYEDDDEATEKALGSAAMAALRAGRKLGQRAISAGRTVGQRAVGAVRSAASKVPGQARSVAGKVKTGASRVKDVARSRAAMTHIAGRAVRSRRAQVGAAAGAGYLAGRSRKADGSQNDLSKVVDAVDSLRKRFDGIEQQMRQPKPRKFKIEKSLDADGKVDNTLQKDIDTVTKWRVEGTKLTPDQERFKDNVVNKMLDAKFGKAL
ncbi:MAG: hypothetical protein E2O29_02045 [Deltaproteobacteria bacterium]|nr:MAG: hypothetical protein E2O29_02045 [Deltaproteobacteria bacterium]